MEIIYNIAPLIDRGLTDNHAATIFSANNKYSKKYYKVYGLDHPSFISDSSMKKKSIYFFEL